MPLQHKIIDDRCLRALHQAFQNYHKKEMEQLKKESFSWLRNKMEDFDAKVLEMQNDFELFHTSRISELHTEFAIKTACLLEENRNNHEIEAKMDMLADSCVSEALSNSLQKDFEQFHTNHISELHTDFAIKTATLMVQNQKNNENDAKIDVLADNCVSEVLSNSLHEIMTTTQSKGKTEEQYILDDGPKLIQNVQMEPTKEGEYHSHHDISNEMKMVVEEVDTQRVAGENMGSSHFNPSSNGLPETIGKSLTEYDSPQELMKYIKTLESEIIKLQGTIDSLNSRDKQAGENLQSSVEEFPLNSGVFSPEGGKSSSGLRVRIREDVVDKHALNQISSAKDDMGRQYQNLLNEFVMEHCEELEKLKLGI